MADLPHALEIIQGLTAIILAAFGWWLSQLNARVRKLEEDVSHYEANVGIGNEKLEAIHREISGHINREEHETWKKIDDLGMQMGVLNVNIATLVEKMTHVASEAERAIAHVAQHDAEANDWKLRIVKLEARMEKVENGKHHA